MLLTDIRSVAVSAENYGEQILPVEHYLEQKSLQILYLAPSTTLKVFVLSNNPGGLLGQQGTVCSVAENGATTVHRFELDHAGSFFVPNIVEGKTSITWHNWPAFELERPLAPPMNISEPTVIPVPLVAHNAILARFVDSDSGEPIANADVKLVVDNNPSSIQAVTTGEDGHLGAFVPAGDPTVFYA